MKFRLLLLVFAACVALSSCGSDNKPKITCVKVKELADFETITWDKIGDLQPLVEQKFEKEIMGKQFGEKSYCTLSLTLKNTSCYTSRFTVHFSLTTFTNKEENDEKTKELKPGEEVEFKSTPFEIKDASDISDKSFTVKTDFIKKKLKVTYDKECIATETKCKCEPQTDDTDATKALTNVKEEPLKCEAEVKAVVQGQVAGKAEVEKPAAPAKKKK
jgi:hypothetical protein